MMLFFRNIPPNTRPTDLLPKMSPELIGKNSQVKKVEILVIRDKSTNQLEHHGLVLIESEIADQNGQTLFNSAFEIVNNKLVHIRKFNRRSQLNDRREQHSTVKLDFVDRRVCDRRRGEMVEKSVDMVNLFIDDDHDADLAINEETD
jgi:hypothetical protein